MKILKNIYIGLIYFVFFTGVVSVEINNFYFYAESEFTESKKETLFSLTNKKINHSQKKSKTEFYNPSHLFAGHRLKQTDQRIDEKNNHKTYKKTLRDTKKPPKKRKSSSSKDSKKRIKKSNCIAHSDFLLNSCSSVNGTNKRYKIFFSELHSDILIPPPKFC